MAISLNYIDEIPVIPIRSNVHPIPPSPTISSSIKYYWELLESSMYSTIIATYIKNNINKIFHADTSKLRLHPNFGFQS
jgi:hypothetical protein